MHWTDRRERFRAVLAGNRCVHPGSVFDPISARIAEELGFEVGMFAGSIASFTVLGAPDLIVLTLTEFAAQAYRINRAGKLPLLVDADHGYGAACYHAGGCADIIAAVAQRIDAREFNPISRDLSTICPARHLAVLRPTWPRRLQRQSD